MNELSCRSRAISRGEDQFDLTWFGCHCVLAAILVTIGVSSNNDGLGPAGDESWDVADYNGLTENGTVKNISNGAVR
jgi:hypothetical protein